MQFLQEIIGLSYIHFYPAVENFLPQGAKNQQLYKAIRDGEVTTDQEASRLIYGSDSAGKKYTMLKQRLKQQVTNNYFRLLSKTSEVSPASLQRRLDYLKQLTIVHTLMGQGRYSLARQLLYYQQKAAAAQFDLFAVQEGLQLLRRIAGYQGEKAAFRRFDTQFQQVARQTRRLQESQRHYESVRLEHRRHLAPSAAVAKLAHQAVTQANQGQQDEPHPIISFYERLLKLFTYFHQGELSRFRRLLFFQRQQMKHHSPLTAYDPLADADLLTMEYLTVQHPKNQSEVVQQAIYGSQDESLPAAARLALREIECVHWLRMAEYRRAEQVCEQLKTETEEETFLMPAHDQARWNLFHAYASYLLRSTQERATPATTQRESMAAVEAAVQPLLTDASGYGWQWFILKMLLWIEDPTLSAKHFIRQIDAYARRHLPQQSLRGAEFFQGIRTVIAGQYRSKISSVDELRLPAPSEQDSLRELVSYEVLWESITIHSQIGQG